MSHAPLTLVPESCASIHAMATLPSDPCDQPASEATRVPEVIGHWRLHSKLGQGATAVVYSVRCGRLLAVMKIEREGAPRSARRCILKEALWLRQNGGAGRPGLIEEGRLDDGRAWLVMSMAPGQNLTGWWQEGGHQQPTEAVRIIAKAARLVGDAHEQGWVHRDLKPANLAVGPDGEVTILDWGLVHTHCQRGSTCTPLAGTPGFIPPEMFRARKARISPELDTYALGCTLIMLLSKRGLRADQLNGATIRTVVREAGLAGIAARTLEHILARAISPTSQPRWSSGHQLAAELECWIRCMAPMESARGPEGSEVPQAYAYRTPA